jgi:manganese/iron transport system permease protein/iron/zinc/copper transport system permease protein
VSTAWVDTLFSLVLAGAIVVSMQVMGVTLIAASIVIPPVTARLLTDSFGRMTVLSVLIGAGCGLVGIYTSYFVDVSSGANIVLVSAVVFMLAYAWSSLRGYTSGLRGVSEQTRAPAQQLFD